MTEVQTVLGPVPASDLGITLTHEHVFIDLVDVAYTPPDRPTATDIDDRVLLDNLWWIRHDWTSSRDNLRLDTESTAVKELLRFRRPVAARSSMPHLEAWAATRNALPGVSECGVHIIRGTGGSMSARLIPVIHRR